MIPDIFVEKWRQHVPWKTPAMVEQDLIISRALICLFSEPKISNTLVFRGGTALNKLFLKPPARYSEDIDFVQKRAEPIGETLSAIRNALNPWLGEPKRKITERGAKLIYKYTSIEGSPAKLKIEINTTEHFQVLDLLQIPYSITSGWFSGECIIETYQLEELMATKLRALYQRRKGRDLFDLWWISSKNKIDSSKMIDIFKLYCQNDNRLIFKDLFYDNLEQKRTNQDFQTDMHVLLPVDSKWNFEEAFEYVLHNIINKIPDKTSFDSKKIIDEFERSAIETM